MSLAWVKNQIWFPEKDSTATEFKEFSLKESFHEETSVKTRFSVGSDHLSRVLLDSEVQGFVDCEIEKKLRLRLVEFLMRMGAEVDSSVKLNEMTTDDLEKIILTEQSRVIERGKELLGELERKKKELENSWDQISDSFFKEKEQLLREHEKMWIKALARIVEKLHLDLSGQALRRIESWLEENLETFSGHQRLKILVSSENFKQLERKDIVDGGGRKWVFEEDDSLSPGVVHLESESAGIIFDPEEGLQKLWGLLEQS